MSTWSKVEELMDFVKTHDIKELKDYWNHREEEKRNNTILWVLAIIGAVAAVAAIAYAVYRYIAPCSGVPDLHYRIGVLLEKA